MVSNRKVLKSQFILGLKDIQDATLRQNYYKNYPGLTDLIDDAFINDPSLTSEIKKEILIFLLQAKANELQQNFKSNPEAKTDKEAKTEQDVFELQNSAAVDEWFQCQVLMAKLNQAFQNGKERKGTNLKDYLDNYFSLAKANGIKAFISFFKDNPLQVLKLIETLPADKQKFVLLSLKLNEFRIQLDSIAPDRIWKLFTNLDACSLELLMQVVNIKQFAMANHEILTKLSDQPEKQKILLKHLCKLNVAFVYDPEAIFNILNDIKDSEVRNLVLQLVASAKTLQEFPVNLISFAIFIGQNQRFDLMKEFLNHLQNLNIYLQLDSAEELFDDLKKIPDPAAREQLLKCCSMESLRKVIKSSDFLKDLCLCPTEIQKSILSHLLNSKLTFPIYFEKYSAKNFFDLLVSTPDQSLRELILECASKESLHQIFMNERAIHHFIEKRPLQEQKEVLLALYRHKRDELAFRFPAATAIEGWCHCESMIVKLEKLTNFAKESKTESIKELHIRPQPRADEILCADGFVLYGKFENSNWHLNYNAVSCLQKEMASNFSDLINLLKRIPVNVRGVLLESFCDLDPLYLVTTLKNSSSEDRVALLNIVPSATKNNLLLRWLQSEKAYLQNSAITVAEHKNELQVETNHIKQNGHAQPAINKDKLHLNEQKAMPQQDANKWYYCLGMIFALTATPDAEIIEEAKQAFLLTNANFDFNNCDKYQARMVLRNLSGLLSELKHLTPPSRMLVLSNIGCTTLNYLIKDFESFANVLEMIPRQQRAEFFKLMMPNFDSFAVIFAYVPKERRTEFLKWIGPEILKENVVPTVSHETYTYLIKHIDAAFSGEAPGALKTGENPQLGIIPCQVLEIFKSEFETKFFKPNRARDTKQDSIQLQNHPMYQALLLGLNEIYQQNRKVYKQFGRI